MVPYAPVQLVSPNINLHTASRVTIDILMIILMIVLPEWPGGVYLLFIANFVTIFGIVFATVWTTNQNWMLRRMAEAGVDARTQSTMHFQSKSTVDALSEYDPYDSTDFSLA